MECCICTQHTTARHPRPFHCATCARTSLYALRIEHIKALQDKDSFSAKVEQVLSGKIDTAQQSISLSNTLIDTNECAKRVDLDRVKAEMVLAASRIDEITEHANNLKEQMEDFKTEITRKKAAMAQRKADTETARKGLETREAREIESVQQSISRTRYRWGRMHNETMAARYTLCREAATLAGLKMKKRKGKDGVLKDEWWLGGSKVVDLRELNTAEPTQLTACLANVANLLVRCTRYLGLRLPAEITLAHRDYPQATIFSPSESYGPYRVPFPTPTPEHSKTSSPSASTDRLKDLPKPKPLFVTKKLQTLYKEDHKAWKLFLEGASLLAWDIGWLCWTQGIGTKESSEGMCNLGKNMWLLFTADPESQQAAAQLIPETASNSNKDGGDPRSPGPPKPPIISRRSSVSTTKSTANPAPPPQFGHYSHAECYGFLGTSEGAEYMRQWPQRLVQLTDRLRKQLEHEMRTAEWEMLDETEWADEGLQNDGEPVVVGIKRAVAGVGSRRESSGKSEERGGSGWTKLKSRNAEGEGSEGTKS